ncbi:MULTISPECIES: 5-methyltetrahydropteroyltriglutamate--homocysteine S-methyltransferase [Asticcacaulis]|uniref:5-methyltetrahydropteroyltriglutamate-- homocysteine S-methyltransferase n=1 Tax=Asticcacaulis TaxID=76890 RepID=UPI001AE64FDF|nr:5-methyltetrahydropteroyltriglutamate--homocysteine S-methyltransferase [Asticcacaulis sp. BE141]MBP2160828.1 5-methyltetrahydropteroyltriglutamate--homocysteine methyltransferase [Asticcacaulis solisilvae]MDR6801968.1 5-methyltetrahydropteroyltriglutamate--homocysteine methyltransferase [Asticcacaulis sp. BE141]
MSHSAPALPVATLGTPRIGLRRELKTALENFWAGKSDAAALHQAARALRAVNWGRQEARGVAILPSNDFSLYDHVLDTSVMVGAIPARYGWQGGNVGLDTYFAMARGSNGHLEGCGAGCTVRHSGGIPALEMTKWFDTNYHYMVPEFTADQRFVLTSQKPVDEFLEAKAFGYRTRPVLLGPVTYLRLGKSEDGNPIVLIDRLIPVYVELLKRLRDAGAEWVQIDEPALALDSDIATSAALQKAYATFAHEVPGLKLLVASYFGGLEDNLDIAVALPIAGLHIDLVRASDQFETVLAKAPKDLVLSLGVIDGRNIWRADLARNLDWLEPVIATHGRDRFQLAPSCSLLHTPIDLDQEEALDGDVRSWLAFSVQKMSELDTLSKALTNGRDSVRDALNAATSAAAARRNSRKVHDRSVANRLKAVTPEHSQRHSPFEARAVLQRQRFNLPAFPTTTIGSFPQTAEIRQARSAHAKGQIDDAGYNQFLKEETERAIRWQEEIGLDVLVHGEFERNDMVQYFGEQLSGFAFTKHAWVQSYGSRCVRPPVLYGDVSRPRAMTVAWWQYAQSLTDKPVKGMLTGPVTILNWSFVRDDLPRSEVCRQIALAIRDEVEDLEVAGAGMIQIDEAALREGLPLRRRHWQAYLDWAVDAFRLSASGVSDQTQIHTHMCYSEFNDILDSVAAMDADVISIETSRSRMELLDAFRTHKYPNDIGPGVYDIHSPRVPDTDEMTELLSLARQRLNDRQLWVNPDCGLKTRDWNETKAALINMVEAARSLRETA